MKLSAAKLHYIDEIELELALMGTILMKMMANRAILSVVKIEIMVNLKFIFSW